jgi:hypothetical protein
MTAAVDLRPAGPEPAPLLDLLLAAVAARELRDSITNHRAEITEEEPCLRS